jgi:uncharacterized membrane protein (DUF106 family)
MQNPFRIIVFVMAIAAGIYSSHLRHHTTYHVKAGVTQTQGN